MSHRENRSSRGRPLAAILGCSGRALGGAEKSFFRDADPFGFILFARNCAEPDQVRRLVGALRNCVGRANAPILIDQEGGRVARLGPPRWRRPPPAATFARLARVDEGAAIEAARLNARLIAAELHELGITVNCAPVLDVPQPGSHAVIGDRALGESPAVVALLGRAVCEGLLDGGVLPVIKHIPGHGRALTDSHKALPVVGAARVDLEAVDFAPFKALRDMPWAMTAHVRYETLDRRAPATTSKTVIQRFIRGTIGFDGVLVSDDLSMSALGGGVGERAQAALAAGCDVVLHCNGMRAEMEEVAAYASPLDDAAQARLHRAEAIRAPPKPFERNGALARLQVLMEGMVVP